MKEEQKHIEGELRINTCGRYAVKNRELHCGDSVQLKLCGTWVQTRVEAYEGKYYFVGLPGLQAATLPARIKA